MASFVILNSNHTVFFYHFGEAYFFPFSERIFSFLKKKMTEKILYYDSVISFNQLCYENLLKLYWKIYILLKEYKSKLNTSENMAGYSISLLLPIHLFRKMLLKNSLTCTAKCGGAPACTLKKILLSILSFTPRNNVVIADMTWVWISRRYHWQRFH